MNRKKDKSQLTEVELELMDILWELQEASVNDVLGEVGKKRKMAYTTAVTILGILEDKKFLRSRKEGKTRIYSAAISRREYEARSLNRIIKKLFNNTPVAMVARLVQEETVTQEELEAMKKILEEKLKDD